MADIQQQILDELKKLNTGGRGGNSAAPAAPTPNQFHDVGLSPLKSQFDKFTGKIKQYVGDIESSLEPWRQAGKHGAAFGNDVVGMAISAKSARLDLNELASIVKENSENFTGLGGSVGKGAKAFTELSKKMFDNSDAIDSLRQLGYTNKELNDVLALQIGFVRSSMKDDATSQEKSIESAKSLATEMDLMAKLTGKSREAQMDEMKKAQADMALESKFRLIGIQQGADAEKAARDNFAKQFNDAQLKGQGQVFKETFAMGTVVSKEAAMTAALTGKAAAETMKQASATVKGDAAAAEEASKKAWAATEANNKNASLMQMGTLAYTGNAVSKSVGEMMAHTNAYHHAIEKIRQEDEWRNKSDQEIHNEAIKRAAAEQKADGGGTDAFLKLQARATDASAAIHRGLVQPLYNDALPAIKTFKETLLPGMVTKKDGTKVGGTEITEKALKDAYAAGKNLNVKEAVKTVKEGVTENTPTGAIATGVVGTGSAVTGAVVTGIEKVADEVKEIASKRALKRNLGSLGATGNYTENFGAGTHVILHGNEGVLKPNDIVDISQRSAAISAQKVGASLQDRMSKIDPTKPFAPGADLLYKQPEKQDKTGPDTETILSHAQTQLGKISSQFSENMEQIKSRLSENMPNASDEEKSKALEEDVEFKKIKDAFQSKAADLMHVIDSSSKIAEKKNSSQVNAFAETNKKMFEGVKDKFATVLDKNGLPSTVALQQKASEIPKAVKQENNNNSSADTKKEEAKNKKEEAKEPAASTKPVESSKDKATLTDVVNRLDRLNSQMGQLITQHEVIGKKQIKATSTNNLYAQG